MTKKSCVPNFDSLHELTINIRNADIGKGLKKEYKEEPCGAALRVFCVSNQLYWKHRMEAVNVSKKFLDLSGIVELRKHCIGVVAENYVRTVRTFIDDTIPALLGSASLWVRSIVFPFLPTKANYIDICRSRPGPAMAVQRENSRY